MRVILRERGIGMRVTALDRLRGVMAESSGQQHLAPTMSFRHVGVRISDALIGERRAGIAEDIADGEGRPGAVPPPLPTRPAPREPLSARLREVAERG